MPDLRFEAEAAAHGACRVVGVDEVGRGPLAGPVVAAAVWLPPTGFPAGLDDSKRLNAVRRAALATALRAVADVGVGHASVAEIDDLDILRASHLAMCRAVSALAVPPDHALIDGNLLPDGLAFGPRGGARRRVLAVDRSGLDPRQGRPRCGNGAPGARMPGLWLGAQRRLSHGGTPRRALAARREPAP